MILTVFQTLRMFMSEVLSSYKNMQKAQYSHKRVEQSQTAKASEFLKQETERVCAEKTEREALLLAEKGTQKEVENNARAAENLRRLWNI